MGRRTFRTFAVAAGVALAAWLAADVLMNLDGLLGVSDAGGDPVGSAAGHYAATLRYRGPWLLAAIAAGSAAVARHRARRAVRSRPEVRGALAPRMADE